MKCLGHCLPGHGRQRPLPLSLKFILHVLFASTLPRRPVCSHAVLTASQTVCGNINVNTGRERTAVRIFIEGQLVRFLCFFCSYT